MDIGKADLERDASTKSKKATYDVHHIHAISVWLVEDDPRFRRTVQRLLDSAPDITCDQVFPSCEGALAALEADFAPEVVLMDIGLPGMSGIDGIRRVKAISPTSDVVILTVHEDDEKIFEAICSGASGYLLKPSSAAIILDAVRSVRHGAAPINPQIAGRILDMFARLAPSRADYGLTTREQEILQHLVGGRTQNGIAEALFLSPHTVSMHIRNIYAKLQVHTRSGAVAKALRERLI